MTKPELIRILVLLAVGPDTEKQQQKFYTTVFRNINNEGKPLVAEESRASLYFLDKDLVGFVMDGSFPTDEQAKKDDIFISFKKGNLNLIVTADVNFYNKFIACSKVAKKLNLIKKHKIVSSQL